MLLAQDHLCRGNSCMTETETTIIRQALFCTTFTVLLAMETVPMYFAVKLEVGVYS